MEKENPYYTMDLGYFNALMATISGNNQEQKLAKEYLKDVDPDIWNDQLDKRRKARICMGAKFALRQVTTHPENCGVYHKTNGQMDQVMSVAYAKILSSNNER